MRRTGPAWALPPRPPDTWLHPAWTPVLLLTLGLAVAVPVLREGITTSGPDRLRLGLDVLACAAAAVTAHALLVDHVVRGHPRLRWLAAGFAVQTGLLFTRSLHVDPTNDRRMTALALLVPTLFVLTSALARAPVALVLPTAAAVGAVVGLRGATPSRALWWGTSALGVLSAVLWWRSDRRTGWVGLTLLLQAGSALAFARNAAPGSTAWWLGTWLLTAGGLVTAAVLGTRAARGFGRQSVRWHRLEREVRAVRTGSPLMPGRAVVPDDDEGLPSREEVARLIEVAHVRIAIQPVVELPTGTVVGHEALSRFGGRVPTDRWFKGASRYGLGGGLERLTVRRALELLDQLPAGEFLAVNVSPAALHDSEVVRLLAEADLTRVVVEITEHEAVADYPVMREILGRLRTAGARIAVDDTGAGFASLRHVLMLQPDLIKLDTSLTRGIERDDKQQALVRAVTGFAAQVGADVLAEGIEEQAQLDALLAIGVRFGQGWHLGVPAFLDNEPA